MIIFYFLLELWIWTSASSDSLHPVPGVLLQGRNWTQLSCLEGSDIIHYTHQPLSAWQWHIQPRAALWPALNNCIATDGSLSVTEELQGKKMRSKPTHPVEQQPRTFHCQTRCPVHPPHAHNLSQRLLYSETHTHTHFINALNDLLTFYSLPFHLVLFMRHFITAHSIINECSFILRRMKTKETDSIYYGAKHIWCAATNTIIIKAGHLEDSSDSGVKNPGHKPETGIHQNMRHCCLCHTGGSLNTGTLTMFRLL